jgi:MFS superfamily sulfate permease-like transporter
VDVPSVSEAYRGGGVGARVRTPTISGLATLWSTPETDLPAGVVVFLVALPLCLGLALASGVPAISGLVAGAVGGLIVPWISRAPLSVSGPAAGLTAIVVSGIQEVGGLPNFLTAVVLAGAIQFCFGLLRIGVAASIVPTSVVRGMLAAIGLLLIATELPAVFGVTSLRAILSGPRPEAAVISGVSLFIIISWHRVAARFPSWLSSSLVVVVAATVINEWWRHAVPKSALLGNLLVHVPTGGVSGLRASLPQPSLEAISRPEVWALAVTLAVVASIESLLSLEAIDLLDPLKRKSDANRELLAQGVGNFISGLCGGLPITSVIVRGSANVAAGARNGLSSVVHGLLMLISMFALASLINRIPVACLAVILIDVGWKLCHPRILKKQLENGYAQAAPYISTMVAIFLTNLLKGVMLGVLVGIGFVLRDHVRGSLEIVEQPGSFVIRLHRDGTFLIKPALRAALARVPHRTQLTVDAQNHYVDIDVKELLAKFDAEAREHNKEIEIDLVGIEIPASLATQMAH